MKTANTCYKDLSPSANLLHIPAALISGPLLTLAYLIWLVAIIAVLRDWRMLRTDSSHVFFGSVVSLLLLWRFDVSVAPGLGFHFLGITVFTLMFGWRLGIIGVALANLGLALSQQADLSAWPINSLLFGLLPVLLSYAVYRGVSRYLPGHVFIYIFLCAFFGAMLAATLSVFAGTAYLVVTGAYSLSYVSESYLPFLSLYLFPEGLLNGFLTTVFIGLRPAWLSTFDESMLKS